MPSFFRRRQIRYNRPGDVNVSRISNESIEPEDIFSDTSYNGSAEEDAVENKLEVPVNPFIVRVFFAVVYLVLISMAGYMTYLAIGRGDHYQSLASENARRVHEIGPSRGDILSNDGEVIARSKPGFDIMVNPSEMDTKEIEQLSNDISAIYEDLKEEDVRTKIEKANIRNLGSLVLVRNLSEEKVSQSRDILEQYEPVSLKEHALRVYPHDNTFSHITGYASAITRENLEDKPSYSLLDNIGKKGIEKTYEGYLRGKDGRFAKFVTANGRVLQEQILSPVKKGNNVQLTVDSGLQKQTRKILQDALDQYDLKRGAAVILNPKNGAVLSLVSLPDFNPNHFSEGLTDEQEDFYFNNQNNPIFNRVTAGEYATGSVIKPFLATAALEENVISPGKQLFTKGYITVQSKYDPSVTYRFDDWKNHGAVDMREAIAVSSNVYFYTIGGGYEEQIGLGIERIVEYLDKFNWGNKLGVNFANESSGRLPTPEWKEENKNDVWRIGDTYNVSIGQGDLLATPIQVAAGTALFANQGTLYRPYVVNKVYSQEGLVDENKNGDIINNNVFSPSSVQVAREGMRGAVEYGSSRYLNQIPVPVAGKTGTAQTSSEKNNAWFTGFAPYNNSEITITVLLENGEKSSRAVRVADRIFKAYFGVEGDVEEDVEEDTDADAATSTEEQ